MLGFKIFKEKLAAVNLRKTVAKINKPFIVGFTVLELSKLLMYQFHYDYVKRNFGNSAQLLFTDTDSLMYLIRGRNPYEQFSRDHKEYFDFGSYPKDHKYYNGSNNKVIGKFSDEASGKIIKEFVGLRPKMYSYVIHNGTQQQPTEKHRAKGIQYQVAKSLKHADFLSQLNNPTENRLLNRRIGSKLHRLYTIEVNKRGLCSFDDKRILLEDGIATLPYGHYAVTAGQLEIGDPMMSTRFPRSFLVENRRDVVPNTSANADHDPNSEEDEDCDFNA